MERRIVKVQIGQAGNGTGARISLSLPFLRDVLNIEKEHRKVLVTYDEEEKKITIKQNRKDEFLRYDILEKDVENILKYDNVLAFVERAANEQPKHDYLHYNPIKAFRLNDSLFLVFAEMEDIERNNFVFSVTAFLVEKIDNELKLIDDFIKVHIRKKYAKTNNLFSALQLYKKFLNEDLTLGEREIFFTLKEFDDEINNKLGNILNLYISKLIKYIQRSKEKVEKAEKEFAISEEEFLQAFLSYVWENLPDEAEEE